MAPNNIRPGDGLEGRLLTSDLTPTSVLRRLFSRLEPDPTWSFEEAGRKETAYLSHSYFRYPAKFIPHIPRRLIQELYNPPGLVVDPFMGSGTTLVEAVVAGLDCYGSDVNLAARIASRAKTRALDPDNLEHRTSALLRRCESDIPIFEPGVSVPETRLARATSDQERLEYWFPRAQLERLGQLFGQIEEEESDVRDFLSCGFAHVLKNCSRWLMASVKPTVDRNKKIPDPLPVLRRHLNGMLKKNRALWGISKRGRATVELADCRDLKLEAGSASLIATSSPYITSYEYADLHQLVTIWFRARSSEDWTQGDFIGTSKVRNRMASAPSGQIAGEIVDLARSQSDRFGHEVATYFSEMEAAFAEFARVLRPGGYACFVIGDTTIRDVEIHNGLAFADSCRTKGLALHDVIERVIPSGGKILPSTRDPATGRFTSARGNEIVEAYSTEYIVIVRRDSGSS